MSSDATPAAGGRADRSSLLTRLGTWDLAIIAVTVLFLAYAISAVENFGTGQNAVFLTLDLAPLLIIALPMTLIIATGEIDLSVASTLGLSSAVMGSLWDSGMAIETIMILCVGLGVVLGAVNGIFVTVLGLPSLAVTIGTLALYRGLALVVLGDAAVAGYPLQYTSWVAGNIGATSVPNIVIPLAVAAALFAVVLHATPFGRQLFAIGANEQAARFSGSRVLWVKFWLYVACGAVSALAGVFWTLRYSSARADNGTGLELAVVAAVLLGGVSIFGGTGTIWGVVSAAVLLTSLQNALRLTNVSNESLSVVTGGLLIFSVLAPNIARSIRDALARRKHRAATRSASSIQRQTT